MTISLRRERAWYLAAAVLIACGGSSATHGGKKGNSGTGGTSGTAGSGQSGTSGTTEPGGGEGGADDGARGGSSPTGGKMGRGGSLPTGGSGHGASSTGGIGGQAGGIGGAAGSGGSSGSSGSSGKGGSGGRLPLPDNCEPRVRNEDNDSCYLSAYCDGTPNTATCSDVGSGVWQCSCGLAHNDRVYQIKGAAGGASCAVAVGLCSEDELDLGAETCSENYQERSEDRCSLDLACGRPITVGFAPGVEASLMSYGSSACARHTTTQPFECNCGTPTTFAEYGGLAESGEQICRPLVDFCMSGREPTFDGSLECFDNETAGNSTYCSLGQLCGRPMRLTADVRIASFESRYAECSTISSGADCYCSTQTSTFDFDVASFPTAETCTLAIANCDPDPDIRVIGEPDCHPTSQTTTPNSCEADLDCPQEATVNSRSIVAHGRLLVACARVEPGQPWRCSCASNQDTTTFELGSPSSTNWEACGLAPAACLERMSVYVGPYGELVPPPDPLADR